MKEEAIKFEDAKSALLDSVLYDTHMGITNEKLTQDFAEALNSGKVILVHAKATSREEFVDMYFAQARDINRGKNLDPNSGGGSSQLRGIAAEGKWGGVQIIRTRDTLNPGIIANKGWFDGEVPTIGAALSEDIAIRMYQNTTPENSEGYDQPSSRVNREDGVYLKKTKDGKEIYEHSYLDRVSEETVLDEPMDFVLELSESEEDVRTAAPESVTAEG